MIYKYEEKNKKSTQEGLLKNIDRTSNLDEIQEYIRSVISIRGFEKEEIEKKMLLLLEEAGELAKAIRKKTKGHLDIAKEYNDSVEEELADCFIYLLSIANMNNVDIFKAFKEKEIRNCDRVWK